jgi:hypothetical protein
MHSRRLALVLLTSILLLTACGAPAATPTSTGPLKLAPVSALPTWIRQLPQEVQEAYRFALANPEILSKIPCYCGCNQIGHMNNRMCYVQSETADGKVVFDAHGSG